MELFKKSFFVMLSIATIAPAPECTLALPQGNRDDVAGSARECM